MSPFSRADMAQPRHVPSISSAKAVRVAFSTASSRGCSESPAAPRYQPMGAYSRRSELLQESRETARRQHCSVSDSAIQGGLSLAVDRYSRTADRRCRTSGSFFNFFGSAFCKASIHRLPPCRYASAVGARNSAASGSASNSSRTPGAQRRRCTRRCRWAGFRLGPAQEQMPILVGFSAVQDRGQIE